MPDFTTHYLFGQEVLDELSDELSGLLTAQSNAFHWGLQGPDLLLFRKAVTGGSLLPKYSDTMHNEKSAGTLLYMEQEAASLLGKEGGEIVTAYYMGFLCHYFLDRTAHPYVFYHEKLRREKDMSFSRTAVHCLLEAQIDSELYREMTGRSVTTFPAGREYRIDPKLKTLVGKLYSGLLSEVYGVSSPASEIEACFHDARNFTKLFYDPTGILRLIASGLEKTMGKKGVLSSHFKRSRIKIDVLNESHEKWCNLSRPERQLDYSFEELFKQAKQDAVLVAERSWRRVKGSKEPLSGDLDIPFANGNY